MSEKTIAEQMQQHWSELKQHVANVEQSTGERYDAVKNKIGEIEGAFAKFDERFNQMEAKMNRPALPQAKEGEMPAEAKDMQEHFRKFLLTETETAQTYRYSGKTAVVSQPRYEVKDGRNVLTFEHKAISVDSDPAGGFLVAPTVSTEIVRRIHDTSPVRQYATIRPISGDAWQEPVSDDGAASGWVGERQSRTATDTPTLDENRIPLHEVYAMPEATQKSIDMLGAFVENWLSDEVATEMAVEESTAFVTGNGLKKPRGLTQYAAATAAWNQIKYVASGHASQLTMDGFISVRADLQPQYLANANWFMNRSTRAAARKLKDAEGNYLWQPNNQLGDPDTLDGRPVVIFEDMPSVSAGTYPVLFGDLRQGYYVIDSTAGMKVLRDPYSNKPYVQFYTTKYVGGGIRQGRALRFMKIAAS